MSTHEMSKPPSTLPLYAKAALQMVPGRSLLRVVPGLSLLPFVAAPGDDVPELEFVVGDVRVDREHLAAYVKVCGLEPSGQLPATYPHALAFPMHVALMTDQRFPFAAVGLVHIENRITQHRPLRVVEPLSLRVWGTGLEPHPKGRKFSVLTEARVGDELVWEEASTYLRRGSGTGGDDERGELGGEDLSVAAEWQLPGDLGRRYAAVSGDRNPIHLHGLSARPFGYPRPIAHGMCIKARCLGALEARLPDAYTVEARFRRPVLLPGRAVFATAQQGGTIRFGVRDAEEGTPHLDGAASQP
jgi:acyl dehydratase